MDTLSGLTGFGFWMAVALVVIAIIWSIVRKQQMKHELTLKLLEKGPGVDPALLAKLIAPTAPSLQKSSTERHREAGGVIGLIFISLGLMFLLMALTRPPLLTQTVLPSPGVSSSGVPLPPMLSPPVFKPQGPSWPMLSLGGFTILLGAWVWRGTMKEYNARKEAEKNLPQD